MSNPKQNQVNFGQRWQLRADSSVNEHGTKPFLWGQPPNFVTGQNRNNLEEPAASLGTSSSAKNGPNTKNDPVSDYGRPPWEYSSEEDKDETERTNRKDETAIPGTEEWGQESGWDNVQQRQQAGTSAPSGVSPSNPETAHFAGTSVGYDRSKDSERVQPFFERRRRSANSDKITFRAANSGLTILLPKGHPDLTAAFRIASETYSHGYNVNNASKALNRFIKRNLLSVNKTQCLEVEDRSAWHSLVHVCRKFITVQSIGVKSAKFEGQGPTTKDAVDNCDLAILYELFDFDVIKEANVEINNPQRKLEFDEYGSEAGFEDASLVGLLYKLFY
uniref:BTB domain-containing protein n=1 Tax=Globodera pallida TaxID=36090 RepID=A0A183BM83_GLOPA